jgi:hypothetical protein
VIAAFDPTLQAVFWTLAIIAYLLAAVASARARALGWLSVSLIAVGLALWHFPQLWDLYESL